MKKFESSADFANLEGIAQTELDGPFADIWRAIINLDQMSGGRQRDILEESFSQRQKTIPTELQVFKWLIPRPFLYLHLLQNPDADPALITFPKWKEFVSQVFNDAELLEQFKKLLIFRSVSTLNPRRYAPVTPILNLIDRVYGEQTEVVLDFGCSLNLGMAAILKGSANTDINDKTELLKGANIVKPPKRVIGYDYQLPDPQWTAACYWPQYIRMAQQTLAGLEEFANASSTVFEFVQKDLTKPQSFTTQADVVHISVMRYMLNEVGREYLDANIASALKMGGFVIETDMFAPGDQLNRPRSVQTRVRRRIEQGLSEPTILIYHAANADGTEGPSDSCKVWFPDKAGIEKFITGRVV